MSQESSKISKSIMMAMPVKRPKAPPSAEMRSLGFKKKEIVILTKLHPLVLNPEKSWRWLTWQIILDHAKRVLKANLVLGKRDFSYSYITRWFDTQLQQLSRRAFLFLKNAYPSRAPPHPTPPCCPTPIHITHTHNTTPRDQRLQRIWLGGPLVFWKFQWSFLLKII